MQLEGIPGLLTITLTITTQDAFPSQALYAMYSSVSLPKPSHDSQRGKCYSTLTLIVFPWGKLTDEFKFRKSVSSFTPTL